MLLTNEPFEDVLEDMVAVIFKYCISTKSKNLSSFSVFSCKSKMTASATPMSKKIGVFFSDKFSLFKWKNSPPLEPVMNDSWRDDGCPNFSQRIQQKPLTLLLEFGKILENRHLVRTYSNNWLYPPPKSIKDDCLGAVKVWMLRCFTRLHKITQNFSPFSLTQ